MLLQRKPLGKKLFCVFCRNNKEEPRIYMTHLIKNDMGHVHCSVKWTLVCGRKRWSHPRSTIDRKVSKVPYDFMSQGLMLSGQRA